LAGEAEYTQQRHGAGQLVDQPLLGSGLHPGANQRNHLANDEQLEVAVLEGTESGRQLRNGRLPGSWMHRGAPSHDDARARRLSTKGKGAGVPIWNA